MWESRKMLFGENAIRRPQLAANGQQLIVRSLADYTVGACTWQARYDYMSITYTDICACYPASSIMYAGYTIIPNGRPTWAPLPAASSQPLAAAAVLRAIILNRLWSNITAGRPRLPL